MSSLHLTEINIYPIKSARGISLPSAQLDDRGLELDRRWMVVDKKGTFLTQRTLPRMALIHVELRGDHLAVRAQGISELSIPLREPGSKMLPVQVWNDSLDAVDVGEDAAAWFTQTLGLSCRLVRMPEHASRFVNPKYAPEKSPVTFADAFPLLLMSRASLDDLNSRLEEPVPMNRFRPNVVVEGSPAYEEDTWRSLRIGHVSFLVAKPCERCAIPTVDQDTGERGKEPIRTLSTYRTQNSKVYFGQNLIHEGRGILKVGDDAQAITR